MAAYVLGAVAAMRRGHGHPSNAGIRPPCSRGAPHS